MLLVLLWLLSRLPACCRVVYPCCCRSGLLPRCHRCRSELLPRRHRCRSGLLPRRRRCRCRRARPHPQRHQQTCCHIRHRPLLLRRCCCQGCPQIGAAHGPAAVLGWRTGSAGCRQHKRHEIPSARPVLGQRCEAPAHRALDQQLCLPGWAVGSMPSVLAAPKVLPLVLPLDSSAPRPTPQQQPVQQQASAPCPHLSTRLPMPWKSAQSGSAPAASSDSMMASDRLGRQSRK